MKFLFERILSSRRQPDSSGASGGFGAGPAGGLRFPGFKILDRYILGKFLSTYFFAIAMIIVVVVLFDYVEKVDDFTELHAPFRKVIFDYYLNFIPFFINQFSGLFTFIACIFFTSKMAYQTEIVAMLSGGMSFRRLMWPYFLGALIIGGLSLTLNLWLIPRSQRKIVAFEAQYIKRKQHTQYDMHIYRQIEPGTFAYIRGYRDGARQASFFVLEHYEQGSIVRSLEASDVKFDPETKRWTAPRYTRREFDAAGVETFGQYRNLDTLINLEAAELGRVNELIQTMNISELNRFLAQQRAKGSDEINIIEVERHARYAYPLSTFILTLIGVSLSSRKVRGGTGLHIGIGTGLCFSYILFNRFFEEFAKSGSLPPWLAVWLPNIIYLFIAVYLYRKAPK
ncbi:MAG: LptF/LptG family permease [Alistipes sp.]|nr:LptF/LptG family permease [Alistipes sp.]